ncbi:MAG: hypothetical protein MJE68_29440, partial [Proteobacteria bacterium]|nr:hypothetical protein [Pseudomonadota bacterium]
ADLPNLIPRQIFRLYGMHRLTTWNTNTIRSLTTIDFLVHVSTCAVTFYQLQHAVKRYTTATVLHDTDA